MAALGSFHGAGPLQLSSEVILGLLFTDCLAYILVQGGPRWLYISPVFFSLVFSKSFCWFVETGSPYTGLAALELKDPPASAS